jgi:hypothetical protein
MHAFDGGRLSLGPEPGTKQWPCRVLEPGLDFVEVLETQPPNPFQLATLSAPGTPYKLLGVNQYLTRSARERKGEGVVGPIVSTLSETTNECAGSESRKPESEFLENHNPIAGSS